VLCRDRKDGDHSCGALIVNTTIVDSVKLASSDVGVCKSEQEQIQKITMSSVSGSADQSSISLSNRGIETIDVGQCCIDSTKNSQSPQQPLVPRIPSSIVRLDLSRNKLTSLPKELFGENNTNGSPSCPMLEYLDVGRNALKTLPSEIRNCKQLKTLIALSNNLRPNGFPLDAVASLPLLELLDLRWNKKMNSQSSRRRLTECFLEGGCKNQQKKQVELLLSPTSTTAQDNNIPDPNAPVAAKKKLSACDRDANELRSQLEPISTPQLRKRLHRTFGVRFDDSDERAYNRENIMQRMLRCYNNSNGGACGENGHPVPQRTVRYERGVVLDPTLLKELLDEMEAIRWPRTTRERPKIASEGYVILQRPPPSTATTTTTTTTTSGPETSTTTANNNKAKREAEKLKRFFGIWSKAVEAIESVDEDFARRFTALAVTKNFKGSPHIDTLNVAPFYGLSLGDFDNGGKLCVECSATCVAEIDTRGRFAKVDGRFCHWVSDYEGTRYSLIYYVTHGDVVPQTTAIFKPPRFAAVGNDEEEKDSHPLEWVPPPKFEL
jgi:hypothetical protein